MKSNRGGFGHFYFTLAPLFPENIENVTRTPFDLVNVTQVLIAFDSGSRSVSLLAGDCSRG